MLTPELIEVLDILACPNCHAPLRPQAGGRAVEATPEQADELACTSSACGLVYPIRDAIPVLLIDEARRPAPGSGGMSTG